MRFYDFIVHFLSNRFVWKCPTPHLVDHSNSHLTENHLEIGIGSGKLFRKSAADKNFTRLVIADVNPSCLEVATENLSSIKPVQSALETWTLNLLDPDSLRSREIEPFDSIGLNYVLHCLPGTFAEKLDICDRLIEHCLKPEGVLFGSTIFPELNPRWLSRKLMAFYNRRSIFHNQDDSPSEFKEWCIRQGRDYNFFAVGCVGLFSVRKPGLPQEKVHSAGYN